MLKTLKKFIALFATAGMLVGVAGLAACDGAAKTEAPKADGAEKPSGSGGSQPADGDKKGEEEKKDDGAAGGEEEKKDDGAAGGEEEKKDDGAAGGEEEKDDGAEGDGN